LEIKEIIKGCKSGKQIAENALFDKYYKHMYNLSMRLLANHNDVEDVLIISFTKVFDNIKKFEYRGDHSLTKWIKTIVINESIRFVKKRDRIKYDDNFPELTTHSEFDSNLSDIDIEQIYSIIEKMPTGYRIVFNLFAIEGYSHKEISELLQISENTSKSQLRKARLDIIKKMNKKKNNGKAQIRFFNKK
jgi:RNA polymerase sigma-70 factor (ECF subfamily)